MSEHLPEVEAFLVWRDKCDHLGDHDPDIAAAYKAIAALEQELKARECCGNCGHLWPRQEYVWCDAVGGNGQGNSYCTDSHCRFTPSRWTRREP